MTVSGGSLSTNYWSLENVEFYNIKKGSIFTSDGKVEVSMEDIAISTNQLFAKADSKASDGLIYFDTNVKATIEFGAFFLSFVRYVSNPVACKETKKEEKREGAKNIMQYKRFPCGPPPQY